MVCTCALFQVYSCCRAVAQESLCARVKVEILQELTLERDAFEARMTIHNGVVGVPIENVQVQLSFADSERREVPASSSANDVSALFFHGLQAGSAVPALVPGGQSSSIRWLIVPSRGAAGGSAQGALYYVGATLRYRAGGEEQEVVVEPDSIRVKPMPALTLDYFLPEQVYGDDPFTQTFVEEVEPYALGVRVKNEGQGVARQVRIESAQPRIVENQLGLLVDFRILGSEVNGAPSAPTLLCDFGDIAPQRAGVGRWTMVSSLSGEFVEFSANYTHADELGGELTSLLTGQPTTHLLVRDVLVDLPGRDGVRDFLSRDGSVLRVYESENADTVVNDVSDRARITGSNGRYSLAPEPSSGFIHIQGPDPEGGRLRLRSAARADGKPLPAANAWLSRRWDRVGLSWDHSVHIFDINNVAGHPYTLVYEAPPDRTNRPPVLDTLHDWALNVGNYLSFPVTAFDPDGDALNYTLLAGPSQVTLNPTTGLLRWRPGPAQAGTHTFRVQVTDGGTPALSDVAEFVVAVKPAVGFELTVGTTNIFSGEDNAVPLVLKSATDLTNVLFVITAPESHLTNLNLSAVGPEVLSPPVIQAVGGGRYALSFEVDALRVQHQTRTLARLGFRSVPVLSTAIVPLPVTNLLGMDVKGAPVTNGLPRDGQVVVFAREPAVVARRGEGVTVYGRPGGSYALERNPEFATGRAWELVRRFPMTNRFHTVAVSTDGTTAYRAYEFEADPPLVEWMPGEAGRALIIYGRPGQQYVLESAEELGWDGWDDVEIHTLTNSFWITPQPSPASTSQFYRVRK